MCYTNRNSMGKLKTILCMITGRWYEDYIDNFYNVTLYCDTVIEEAKILTLIRLIYCPFGDIYSKQLVANFFEHAKSRNERFIFFYFGCLQLVVHRGRYFLTLEAKPRSTRRRVRENTVIPSRGRNNVFCHPGHNGTFLTQNIN